MTKPPRSTLEPGVGRTLAVKDGPIGWLIYDHQARRNALTVAMQAAVPAIVADFAADAEIRVVVVRGAGERAFAAGADVTEIERERGDADGRRRFAEVFGAAASSLAELDQPVIAMIHGYCFGAGIAVALQADLRIAADDAKLAIPAARLGVGYGYAGVKQLVDLVGPAVASELLFTARRFGAEEALHVGLLNRVVEKSELEATVRELALGIAANAPLTLLAAKVAIREAMKDPARRDRQRCDRLVEACFESADLREGRRAFLEKRPPVFRGE